MFPRLKWRPCSCATRRCAKRPSSGSLIRSTAKRLSPRSSSKTASTRSMSTTCPRTARHRWPATSDRLASSRSLNFRATPTPARSSAAKSSLSSLDAWRTPRLAPEDSMRALTATAVQFELRAEPTFDAFADHLTAVIDAAAADGAELVVLPELATTGLLASHPEAATLRVGDLAQAYRDVFPPLSDGLIELLRSLATRLGITVLGGSHFRRAGDGSHRNTAH